MHFFVSDKNHHHRQSNNVMKILDAPLQISSLEQQQQITERPPPAWFAAEKKITTVSNATVTDTNVDVSFLMRGKLYVKLCVTCR